VFEQSAQDALASESMSVVVPIHDAPAVTRRCLASLERYAPKSEVILVDDGSELPITLEILQECRVRNGWKVIRHVDALGHSRACEAGAGRATRPHLCLLNSDTVVTPWCWRILQEAFETDTRIGVAGPSTCSSGNAQTIPLAENCRHYWNEGQICVFAGRLMGACPAPTLVDLPFVCGCAFFIRRRLWEELDGFDANLPDYGNEEELCKRVAKLGYRIVWVRNAYIHHVGAQSYGDGVGWRRGRAAARYIAEKHPDNARATER
jgi:GT2 family glycosyltransferase